MSGGRPMLAGRPTFAMTSGEAMVFSGKLAQVYNELLPGDEENHLTPNDVMLFFGDAKALRNVILRKKFPKGVFMKARASFTTSDLDRFSNHCKGLGHTQASCA